MPSTYSNVKRRAIFNSTLTAIQPKYADCIRGRGEEQAGELRRMMEGVQFLAEKGEIAPALNGLKALDVHIDSLIRHQPVGERAPKSIDSSSLPNSVKESIANAKAKQQVEPAKKHADPLLIASLLEKREQASSRLEALRDDPDAEEQSFTSIREEIERIDLELEELGHKGAFTKELSAALRESDMREGVVYANSEDSRAEYQVKLNEDGLLVDSQGNLVHGRHGYVVSADDGAMLSFNEDEGNKRGKALHHSTPVAGGAVKAAGEQVIEGGVIREIGDQSGHYKPDGKMIHQYVAGLIEDGAKLLDESIVAMDAAGKLRSATNEERGAYANRDRVKELPALRKSLQQNPEDLNVQQSIAELEHLQRVLKESGVGPRNKDATVLTYKASTRFNEEDWENVQGDREAIINAICSKLGTSLLRSDVAYAIDKSIKGSAVDPRSMEKTNDFIAPLLRMGEYESSEGLVDKSVAYNSLPAEQFAQTGGNAAAIKGKQATLADVLASDQTHIVKQIQALNGEQKLRDWGFDPEHMSHQFQLNLLETVGLGENVKENLEGLRINDPMALSEASLVAVLQSVEALKRIDCFPLPGNGSWQMENIPDIALLVENLPDIEHAKKNLKEGQEAEGDDDFDDASVLGILLDCAKQGNISKLVPNPSSLSSELMIGILRQTNDFAEVNSLELISHFKIFPTTYSSAAELLQELRKKRLLFDGQPTLLKLLGNAGSNLAENLQVEVIQRADEFAKLDAPQLISDYSIDISRYPNVNALLQALQNKRVLFDGQSTLLKLLGNAGADLAELYQVEVIQRADEFAKLDPLQLIDLYNINLRNYQSPSALLDTLQGRRLFHDDGGQTVRKFLGNGGLQLSPDVQRAIFRNAEMFQDLDCLNMIEQYDLKLTDLDDFDKLYDELEKVKNLYADITKLGLDPSKIERDKQVEIVDEFDTFIDFGGQEELQKNGIDLYDLGVDEAKDMVNAVLDKRTLTEFGLNPDDFTADEIWDVADQKRWIDDLGGMDVVKSLGIEFTTGNVVQAIELLEKSWTANWARKTFQELGLNPDDFTEEQIADKVNNPLAVLGFSPKLNFEPSFFAEILKREQDFAGLGGIDKLKQVGVTIYDDFTVDDVLTLLETVRKIESNRLDPAKYWVEISGATDIQELLDGYYDIDKYLK